MFGKHQPTALGAMLRHLSLCQEKQEVTEDFKTLIFEEQLKDLITQKSSCYAIFTY